MNSSITGPAKPQPPSVHLAIWVGASAVWALASLRLIGSRLGRRIVLVVALAGGLYALGQYLPSLGKTAGHAGMQFLSSEQLAQYGGTLEPWARLLIYLGLALAWTIGSVALLRRVSPEGPAAMDDSQAHQG